MNIMTGCLSATYGTVKIGGYDIYKDAKKAKALIGYLPELPPLYVDRTPREYLSFVARAKNVNKREIQKQIDDAMEKTGISAVADRLIRHLSKGYRQRVGIAQAIIGDPDVIILDEPTVGLDPAQIIEIRELIKNLGESRTVILSSHILSEVQAVCSTVLILSRGRLVACDTPENLEKMFSGKVSIFLTAETSAEKAKDILCRIRGVESVSLLSDEGRLCHLKVSCSSYNEDEMGRRIFYAFSDANRAILKMIPEKATLESVFIELTGKPDNPASYQDPGKPPLSSGEHAPSAEEENRGKNVLQTKAYTEKQTENEVEAG